MSFLIFAAPIIFIIIFVIFIAVFSSDSKKYRRNLDNNKQMQLDEARENALKAVEKIRRNKMNLIILMELLLQQVLRLEHHFKLFLNKIINLL